MYLCVCEEFTPMECIKKRHEEIGTKQKSFILFISFR